MRKTAMQVEASMPPMSEEEEASMAFVPGIWQSAISAEGLPFSPLFHGLQILLLADRNVNLDGINGGNGGQVFDLAGASEWGSTSNAANEKDFRQSAPKKDLPGFENPAGQEDGPGCCPNSFPPRGYCSSNPWRLRTT